MRPSSRGFAVLASVLATIAAGSSLAVAHDEGPPPDLDMKQWFVYQAPSGRGDDTELRIVRDDGTGDHALVTGELPFPDHAHPDWSPDGARIAFDVWSDDDPASIELWAVGTDGADPERLAACEDPCLQLAYPAWSPGGDEIAFVRYDYLGDGVWGPNAVEVLERATGARRIVTETADGTSAYFEPTWSPDGGQIAFTIESYSDATATTTLSSSIAVVPADGSGPSTIVTPPEMVAGAPDWAPGARIVFGVADTLGGWTDSGAVYVMAPDGSGVRSLTSGSDLAFAVEPVWARDGESVLFTTGDPETGEQWLASIDAAGGDVVEMPWRLDDTPGMLRTHVDPRP
jgi:Tol biopolymer transport system component